MAAAKLLFQGVLNTRPQLGFNGVVQNIAHVPALLMLLVSKSSHVGPPELLHPFFRGLVGRLATVSRPLQPSDGPSQPPQTRRQLPLPVPGLPLVPGAAPRSQSEAGMMARDVAAVAGLCTGNLMHSARHGERNGGETLACYGTIT